MLRALNLAKKGIGAVSPNPLVGSVIVKAGKKFGEGYHTRFGERHAEIVAIDDALSRHHSLRGATLYVNLEPCAHHGKTPPCVDAIIAQGISRVVMAMKDPNPLVSGKGLSVLQYHGIECSVGLLQRESVRLNEKFMHHITTGFPFVAVKAAQTADGFIARSDRSPEWISNAQSRRYAHRLRIEYDAVLIGAGTVMNDDPQLTVRNVKGRNPLRVVVDGLLSVPVGAKVFQKKAQTVVYTCKTRDKRHRNKIRQLISNGVDVVELKGKQGRIKMKHVLEDLSKRNIGSVLVEGGQQMYSAFFNERLVNALYLFTSRKKYRFGLKTFDGISVSYKRKKRLQRLFGNDVLNEFSIQFHNKI